MTKNFSPVLNVRRVVVGSELRKAGTGYILLLTNILDMGLLNISDRMM